MIQQIVSACNLEDESACQACCALVMDLVSRCCGQGECFGFSQVMSAKPRGSDLALLLHEKVGLDPLRCLLLQ